MAYSIDFDWFKELRENFDNWENLGRRVAEDSCKHHTQGDEETNMRYSGWCEECGFYEDSCEPMMNYAYKLRCEPSEEDILKVISETCLTVMHKLDTDEYFLVLCGGGMNLSQDIGLAYLLLDESIPYELCIDICKQKGLSVGGENWKFLRISIIEQLKRQEENLKRYISEWEDTEE